MDFVVKTPVNLLIFRTNLVLLSDAISYTWCDCHFRHEKEDMFVFGIFVVDYSSIIMYRITLIMCSPRNVLPHFSIKRSQLRYGMSLFQTFCHAWKTRVPFEGSDIFIQNAALCFQTNLETMKLIAELYVFRNNTLLLSTRINKNFHGYMYLHLSF